MRQQQMIIHKASSEHIPDIERLYALLFAHMANLQPEYYQKAKQDVEFIQRMIESEVSEIFIALENENLTGFIVVQEQVTPLYNCIVSHRFAFVIDLIVDPAYRRQEVGTLLLRQVKQWAKQRGLNHVELCALAENEEALRLYQKLDFKACTHTLRLKL